MKITNKKTIIKCRQMAAQYITNYFEFYINNI